MDIRVLWIDDEFEKQSDFIGFAEQDDIEIVPMSSHDEGMSELEKDIYRYHAVILDAKVKKGKDDVVPGLKGLAASIHRLTQINKDFYLPYFIFTGQPDYMASDVFSESYGKYFIKGIENQKLLDEIRLKTKNKQEFIVERNFRAVFDIADKYFDGDTRKLIMQILLSIQNPLDAFDDTLYFTRVRTVLESFFRVANRYGLLHDNCLSGGKVNLTESSRFLAGEPTRYCKVKCAQSHFPIITAGAVQSILLITGAASHTADPDFKNNIDLQDYRKQINTPYLLYTLTFQLLDLLVWFDGYLQKNNDVEKNKAIWINIEPLSTLDDSEWQTGEVLRIDSTKGFGFFKPNDGGGNIFIPPDLVTKYILVETMPIKIQAEEYIDLKTQSTKKRVKNIFINNI